MNTVAIVTVIRDSIKHSLSRFTSFGSIPYLIILDLSSESKLRLRSRRRVMFSKSSWSIGTSFVNFSMMLSSACTHDKSSLITLTVNQTSTCYQLSLTISVLFSMKMLSFLRKLTTRMSSSWCSLSRQLTSIFTTLLFLIFFSTSNTSARFNSK